MGLWRDRAVRALPFVAVTQRASAAGPRGVQTKLARAHAPRSGGVPVGACRRPTRRGCTGARMHHKRAVLASEPASKACGKK